MGRDLLTQCSQIGTVLLREQAMALFAADLGAGGADLPGVFLDERRTFDKELLQAAGCFGG
jgi:hypothetical protein